VVVGSIVARTLVAESSIVRNPIEEPICGYKLVGFRWSRAEVRKQQAPGWAPICSFNLLGFFIGVHAARMTSCGNGFKLALRCMWVQSLTMSRGLSNPNEYFSSPLLQDLSGNLPDTFGETLVQRALSKSNLLGAGVHSGELRHCPVAMAQTTGGQSYSRKSSRLGVLDKYPSSIRQGVQHRNPPTLSA